MQTMTMYVGTLLSLTCAAQVSPTEVYLVVNAGCREKDLAHIGKHLDKFTVSGLLHGKHTVLLSTRSHPAQTISQSVF